MRNKISLCFSILTLATVTFFSSCNQFASVNGNGNVISEQRPVATFKAIRVEGGMNVFLQPGPTKTATIDAESNIVPLIELVPEGDLLIVRMKNKVNARTHGKFDVHISTEELSKVSVAGSGNIELDGQFASKNEIQVKIGGSGSITGQLDAPKVSAAIAGAGDIKLSGQTRDLTVSIGGAGDFEGTSLLSENAEVKIAGSGDAKVHASVSLKAKIAGSGDISYKGSPQISSSIAGSGSVKKLD
ncbi:head GIN domain-containing protein [Chitinophaga sp. Hz27]|uniref:head GIN domain-containing protein n=1 Tax=Chitinophaga sp. Hz27 TaxID=3347169 RepID=UPI0035DA1CF0